MVVSTLVPVAEYLRTSYRPDCDYLEGVILERNVGEYDHSKVQTTVAGLLNARGKEWRIEACVELRVNVRPGRRYRVPDVVVLDESAPREQIIACPPVLCIEVLSPDDRMSEMDERISDYFELGVSCVWVLDPRRRKAFIYTRTASVQATEVITVPGTAIALGVQTLFAGLK